MTTVASGREGVSFCDSSGCLHQIYGSSGGHYHLLRMPTHANAVLLIYNSGGQPHGLERGRIGIDAHHQIIARPE